MPAWTLSSEKQLLNCPRGTLSNRCRPAQEPPQLFLICRRLHYFCFSPESWLGYRLTQRTKKCRAQTRPELASPKSWTTDEAISFPPTVLMRNTVCGGSFSSQLHRPLIKECSLTHTCPGTGWRGHQYTSVHAIQGASEHACCSPS